MTDSNPDRPGQCLLDDAICAAILKTRSEWTITSYEVVGVLTMIAARYAHLSVAHVTDEEDEP